MAHVPARACLRLGSESRGKELSFQGDARGAGFPQLTPNTFPAPSAPHVPPWKTGSSTPSLRGGSLRVMKVPVWLQDAGSREYSQQSQSPPALEKQGCSGHWLGLCGPAGMADPPRMLVSASGLGSRRSRKQAKESITPRVWLDFRVMFMEARF